MLDLSGVLSILLRAVFRIKYLKGDRCGQEMARDILINQINNLEDSVREQIQQLVELFPCKGIPINHQSGRDVELRLKHVYRGIEYDTIDLTKGVVVPERALIAVNNSGVFGGLHLTLHTEQKYSIGWRQAITSMCEYIGLLPSSDVAVLMKNVRGLARVQGLTYRMNHESRGENCNETSELTVYVGGAAQPERFEQVAQKLSIIYARFSEFRNGGL